MESVATATPSQKKPKASATFPIAKNVNPHTRDYSIRYAPNWTSISRQCKELTKFKCCLCRSKAVETHHAVYADAAGLIAGREIPGVHVFPLCDRHHKESHKAENWIHHHNSPVAGNKTTSAYYSKLLAGWNSITKLSLKNTFG